MGVLCHKQPSYDVQFSILDNIWLKKIKLKNLLSYIIAEQMEVIETFQEQTTSWLLWLQYNIDISTGEFSMDIQPSDLPAMGVSALWPPTSG